MKFFHKKSSHETEKKSRKIGKIFGITLSGTPETEVLEKIDQKLHSRANLLITTPNPEILLLARKDRVLARILNSSDIAIPDGVGVIMAHKYLSMRHYTTKVLMPLDVVKGIWVGASLIFGRKWLFSSMKPIKGRLLMLEIVKLAWKAKKKVYLIAPSKVVLTKSLTKLHASFPNLIVNGRVAPQLSNIGKPLTSVDSKIESELVRDVAIYSPDVTIVALGAPRQEKWLDRWHTKIHFGVAIGVGGALDMYSGNLRAAPRWIAWGFEWVWRLMFHKVSGGGQSRIRRVARSVIVFPLSVFKYRNVL